MNLITLTILLIFLFGLTNAFEFYEVFNSRGFFMKEFNKTFGMFDSSPTSTHWIEQPLDHFDENENRTWNMRYFKRLDLWQVNGPIYLFINGEWEATDGLLRTGIMYELAKETHGALYSSEHRYYGKSLPFKDFTTANLTYLSAKQALADVAKLLREIKLLLQYNESKVVVVGGSYSGNLAAWMKHLYPELVDAAIASSAPVLAKKDFYEYIETVSDVFEQYGTSGCHGTVRNLFNKYDELFKSCAGIDRLKEEEKICNSTDMGRPENKQLFFLSKAAQFMNQAQYGNPDTIKNYCEKMQNNSYLFLSTENEHTTWSKNKNCFNYNFNDMIESMKQVDWITAWTYQTCTEFGYFMSTSSKSHPFTDNIPVKFYYNMCEKMYGPNFNEKRVDRGIEDSNNLYGGLYPNVTQVVFVNGDMDPWSKLGILEDVSYNAPAKVIARSSHCRDLVSDRPKDPEELKEARKYIKYLIKKWIGVGAYNNP